MISMFWGVFAALFLALAIFHFNAANSSLPEFEVKPRRLEEPRSDFIFEVDGSPLDEPLKQFVDAFNGYVQDLNRSSKASNRAAAGGYLLASLTALVSLVLSLAKG